MASGRRQMSSSTGQLESMMLQPCRGTASFCVGFEGKKGLKGPSSGRYDLFVPRASCAFSNISILKNFTHGWRVYTHKKKHSELYAAATASATAAGGKGAHFFISASNIYVMYMNDDAPSFFRSFITSHLCSLFFVLLIHSLHTHYCSVEGTCKVSISRLYVYIHLRRAR